jgi:hypothetical protein
MIMNVNKGEKAQRRITAVQIRIHLIIRFIYVEVKICVIEIIPYDKDRNKHRGSKYFRVKC